MKSNNLAARFRRPRMGRRLIALALSLTVMGIGIAMFKTVGFGTSIC